MGSPVGAWPAVMGAYDAAEPHGRSRALSACVVAAQKLAALLRCISAVIEC